MLSLKCLEKSSLSGWKKSAPVPKRKPNVKSLNLQAHSTRYSNTILRMASYFVPYIMHFIEINYISCIPLQRPVFTCTRQNIKWSLSHALLYSFIVFQYVILILRKDKYILERIELYFWDMNYFRDLGSAGKYF